MAPVAATKPCAVRCPVSEGSQNSEGVPGELADAGAVDLLDKTLDAERADRYLSLSTIHYSI